MAYQYGRPSTFILPADRYDILVEADNARQTVFGVDVGSGQTAEREVNLGSGVIALQVFTTAGQPAATNGRLTVQALRPDDHALIAATSFNNPARLPVPAGRYDLRVQYGSTSFSPLTGGQFQVIVPGVEVRAGETTTQDLNLHLGTAQLTVFEAAGKPANPRSVDFLVYPHSSHDAYVVSALYTNSVSALLPAGAYDLDAAYTGTALRLQDSLGTFEVKKGRASIQA